MYYIIVIIVSFQRAAAERTLFADLLSPGQIMLAPFRIRNDFRLCRSRCFGHLRHVLHINDELYVAF